jgi:hypothetical protein
VKAKWLFPEHLGDRRSLDIAELGIKKKNISVSNSSLVDRACFCLSVP